MWALFIIGCFAVLLFAVWRKASSSQVAVDAPPKVAGALPILGHAHKLTSPDIFDVWRKDYGDIYTIAMAGRDCVVVHDLAVMKNCLRAAPEFIDFAPLLEVLLGYDGDVSRFSNYDRGNLNTHILKSSVLSRMNKSEAIIVQSCKSVIEKLFQNAGKSELDIEISKLAKLVVGDSTGKFIFELDLPSSFYEQCAKLESLQMKAFGLCSLIGIRTKAFKVWVYRDYMKLLHKIYDTYLRSIIAECRKNPGRSTFVDSFVNFDGVGDKSGFGAHSDEEIGLLLVALVLASMSNTTQLTTHVIARLMKNPIYLNKVKEELNVGQISNGTEHEVTNAANVPVLDAFVHESARCAFAILGSMRLVMQDYEMRDDSDKALYTIRKGSTMMFPHASKHHNQEVFSDPKDFNPERFLQLKERKSDVMNWGGGIHMCPGKNLALQEARLIPATMLRNYDVKPINLEKYGDVVWDLNGAVAPIGGQNFIRLQRKAK